MDLPKRKKIRLDDYDYSSCGAYFVTLCVKDRAMFLWNEEADITRPDKPRLSQYGAIAEKAIFEIPAHYENVRVDKFCIMPNHIHMIVSIGGEESGRILSAPTLSVVIGSMKRWVSKQVGFHLWQKSYNDRIIRSEREYLEIWKYIDENAYINSIGTGV